MSWHACIVLGGLECTCTCWAGVWALGHAAAGERARCGALAGASRRTAAALCWRSSDGCPAGRRAEESSLEACFARCGGRRVTEVCQFAQSHHHVPSCLNNLYIPVSYYLTLTSVLSTYDLLHLHKQSLGGQGLPWAFHNIMSRCILNCAKSGAGGAERGVRAPMQPVAGAACAGGVRAHRGGGVCHCRPL